MDMNKEIFEINKWLTTKEASSYLSISENAMRILSSRYKITKYKLGDKSVRYKVSDLDSLLRICKSTRR
jgi:hypothetical protein